MEFSFSTKFHNPHLSFMVLLFIATTILDPVNATKGCDFHAIFNFGDSNSDTGGLAASLDAPTPPYGETYFHRITGRFSDGRLIIDFMGNYVISFFYIPIDSFNVFEASFFSTSSKVATSKCKHSIALFPKNISKMKFVSSSPLLLKVRKAVF